MGKPTDIQTVAAALYFLPVRARAPLKSGAETITEVTCARARVTVADAKGRRASGWGETPLSVQWAWPGQTPCEERHQALRKFCVQLAELWSSFRTFSHPLEMGHDFQRDILPGFLRGFNHSQRRNAEPLPWRAALLCCSAFDIAAHDAYGCLLNRPVHETCAAEFLNRDLSAFLQPAAGAAVSFRGKYPGDFLVPTPPARLAAWHHVGGLDPLDDSELTGAEPNDGHPVLLADWIQHDGLACLKLMLRGNDEAWDCQRILKVGRIAEENGVHWLALDFNGAAGEPAYVNGLLDRLRDEQPRLYGMVLYVAQPFPGEWERQPIDVHSASARKPLFLDEGAHDWERVRRGRELGWMGVALRTCTTQTAALLSGCWAKAHGMGLMVQDIANPMLAQIPHVQLAAHFGTIMGVEANAAQFYPEASQPEARVHPGLYQRRNGRLDLSSIRGGGFGYRVEEMQRELPPPAIECGS